MPTTLELLREGRREEIWQKYCGFLDLSMDEFMDIQRRLLMEQIELLSRCELGQKLFGKSVPSTVDEFRRQVPLTTYEFYAPYLLEKREDALPVQPQWWLRTSGRSGEYAYKWVPYTPAMVERLGECSMAGLIFASSLRKGEFVFEEHDTMLFALAPFPYISGAIGIALESEFNFSYVPPMEEAVQMEFQERISEGFRLALKTGIDGFNGLASVLAKIGDQFAEGGSSLQPSLYYLHPKVLARLVTGLVRARLAGRKHLLPKDLWNAKCIGTGGTDTVLFRERIKEYWGRSPVEAFACTEGGLLSNQLWNCKGMTFYPDVCFLEFVPEDEHLKSREDPSYTPRTLLLDEVQAGQRYELVFTNFMGGAMVRYRVGDIIEIIALADEELGIELPQMVFYARADDIIDLASITRLTETALWQAIANAGFAYTDWVARKEYEEGNVLLHIYLEPKDEAPTDAVRGRISDNLKELEPSYGELERLWNVDPLRLTMLPMRSFSSYYQARRSEGADLAHLKPPHMNPSDQVLGMLLSTKAEERPS